MEKQTKKYIVIGSIVAGVITAFLLKNAIGGAFKNLGNRLGNIDDKKATKKELKDLEQDGVAPTHPVSWFKDKVSSLVAQAEGCGKYNDIIIVDIMKKLNNDADYLFLKKEFGIRKWDACGVWTGWDEGNLTYLLTSELSTGNIDLINTHFKVMDIKYTI
jgi:hypothetical protein